MGDEFRSAIERVAKQAEEERLSLLEKKFSPNVARGMKDFRTKKQKAEDFGHQQAWAAEMLREVDRTLRNAEPPALSTARCQGGCRTEPSELCSKCDTSFCEGHYRDPEHTCPRPDEG